MPFTPMYNSIASPIHFNCSRDCRSVPCRRVETLRRRRFLHNKSRENNCIDKICKAQGVAHLLSVGHLYHFTNLPPVIVATLMAAAKKVPGIEDKLNTYGSFAVMALATINFPKRSK